MPGNPVKLSYTDEESFSPPPHLGQHTKEILRDWADYDSEKLNILIDNKIIESAN
jgi:crotonobetainyl-CoA:carnitine CoA-transferase CaiB-like acyl-CoA transferase